MTFGKTFWACLCAVIIASVAGFFINLVLFFSLLGSLSSLFTENSVDGNIKENSVLRISLNTEFTEMESENPFSAFDFNNFEVKKRCSLSKALNAISWATEDPNIAGIFIDAEPGFEQISNDHAYQLRQALLKFHEKSGKFILSYGDGYSLTNYWVCSVSDYIFLNPHCTVDWVGLSGQYLFFKDALDKLSVEPEIFRVGKYKSAVEPFMRSEMSDENRLQNQQLLKSIWNTIVSDVSTSRSLTVETLNRYADSLSISTAEKTLNAKIVDSLSYRNDFMDYLGRLVLKENSSDISMVDISDYNFPDNFDASSKVAVLTAEGEMVDYNNLTEENCIVGRKLSDQIDRLTRDSSIKAVVLRINSPGGSVTAAAQIRNSVLRLKKVKPVVVSMGEYAASGGYYVSAPADAIVSSPVTLTGSIGIFGLVFNFGKTLKNFLGVNVESISTNANSSMSIVEPLSPMQKKMMQNSIEEEYGKFIALVSEGRNMSVDAVENIAGGRVWSGQMAIQNGLVDKVGTFEDAIQLAAQKAGLTDYSVTYFPKPEDDFVSLFLNSASSAAIKLKASVFNFNTVEKVKKELKKREGVQALMPYKLSISTDVIY